MLINVSLFYFSIFPILSLVSVVVVFLFSCFSFIHRMPALMITIMCRCQFQLPLVLPMTSSCMITMGSTIATRSPGHWSFVCVSAFTPLVNINYLRQRLQNVFVRHLREVCVNTVRIRKLRAWATRTQAFRKRCMGANQVSVRSVGRPYQNHLFTHTGRRDEHTYVVFASCSSYTAANRSCQLCGKTFQHCFYLTQSRWTVM